MDQDFGSNGENHPCMIIMDPHAEYVHAFGDSSIVYRAYNPVGNDREDYGTSLTLPYWLMSADEFRGLVVGKTEYEATSQHNVVYKALAHARMVYKGIVQPAPSDYGVQGYDEWISKGHPLLQEGYTMDDVEGFDFDKPLYFDIQEFENHIRYIQAARIKGNVSESVPEGEFRKEYGSILDKLAVLRRDKRVSFLMRPGDHVDLTSVLRQLIGQVRDEGVEAKVRIVDISGIPNEVAGPLTALIGRLLFQYKLFQTYEERRRDPVLFVCEEAHRYVPSEGFAEYEAAQNAVRRIAREGRKYGLGLMLVSQRPSDIEKTVISQCGTWFVHRLGNPADKEQVARFLPDSVGALADSLSGLRKREALFVGEGAALPCKVLIRHLPEENRPGSDDVSYAVGWSTPVSNDAGLREVVSRMEDALN